MLNTTEKYIIENLIDYYKKQGGTLHTENLYKFKNTIRNVDYESHTIIDKTIAIGLIKYKLSDRTGITVLTEPGWNFTTFDKFEQTKNQEKEIYEITIDKLRTDLKNSKRQSISFYPLTALTIILGILSIVNFSTPTQERNSIKHLELRADTTSRAVKDLTDKIDSVRHDISTRDTNFSRKK